MLPIKYYALILLLTSTFTIDMYVFTRNCFLVTSKSYYLHSLERICQVERIPSLRNLWKGFQRANNEHSGFFHISNCYANVNDQSRRYILPVILLYPWYNLATNEDSNLDSSPNIMINPYRNIPEHDVFMSSSCEISSLSSTGTLDSKVRELANQNAYGLQ